jgi:hypothetical protein
VRACREKPVVMGLRGHLAHIVVLPVWCGVWWIFFSDSSKKILAMSARTPKPHQRLFRATECMFRIHAE